eukprot:TRINITY_DN1888_c0_g1_i1.p1 TRINITY_DN1888_c0_g1~~TRINITY_DN1888_c0_g1_i1.p1  ORF type:complete len:346 (-),score=66.95 TRINITY_DN1888_c0_g1_i1:221-1258(-)
MPGLSKLGPVRFRQLQRADGYQSKVKSNLTEALKWPRVSSTIPYSRPSPRCAIEHSLIPSEKDSHDSENDLASMVRDFLENDSSGHDGSYPSSDSDSGTSSFAKVAEKIKSLKIPVMTVEEDLLSLIHVIILSKEFDVECVGEGACSLSCIKKYLVKLLISSGYHAALCYSKWKGTEKVPGGEHEYIDVTLEGDDMHERLIIDVDFQSHFEIARPTLSYLGILKSLPVIFIGTLDKLEQILETMVEAAKFSLKQNLMPLPPWRTFGYLSAKWFSPYEKVRDDTGNKYLKESSGQDWKKATHSKKPQCLEQWKRLRASICSDVDVGPSMKPLSNGCSKGVWKQKSY